MMPEEAKKLFIEKYSSFGDEKFYKFLLNYAINRIITDYPDNVAPPSKPSKKQAASPEAELMDYYDKFLILYRRGGEAIHLDIAKLFRKAANKIYRIMLKKNIIEKVEKSNKFLNLV